MKHEGRSVVRIDDKTDHGGTVITASSETVVMGKVAALADDMTFCPKCKGKFAIKPDGKGAKHQGRPYAYHDDVTECGARLISSLGQPDYSGSTATKNEGKAEDDALPDRTFDDRFVLLNDETGGPAAFKEYAIQRENGTIEHGITDAKGETHIVSATARAEKIKIYVEIDS